jgi:hypothetical protein
LDELRGRFQRPASAPVVAAGEDRNTGEAVPDELLPGAPVVAAGEDRNVSVTHNGADPRTGAHLSSRRVRIENPAAEGRAPRTPAGTPRRRGG